MKSRNPRGSSESKSASFLTTACIGLAVLSSLPATYVTAAESAAAPEYLRQSLYVPVRDGTRLAVNIYRPATGGQAITDPKPVVFVFTPYRARFKDDKGKVNETALDDNLGLQSLLRAGYVVAVADIRGKGASFGHRRGFQDRTEAQDGHDLVEWLAHQPFSTGNVGMIGCSYYGGTTFHTASTAPPSLKAVFIGASDLDKYNFVRAGGITAQFNTRPDEPASVDLASLPVDADANGDLLRQAVSEHAQNTPMGPLWYGMPYRDSVSTFTGNAFWDEVGVYNYLDAIRKAGIATYFWGNWQDEPTAQTILAAANLNSKFLGGPGGHCVPPPGFDFAGEITRYFDHYLKDVDNGIEKAPRATYWVEGLDGKGKYIQSDSLPGAKSTPLSLQLNASDKTGAAPGLSARAGKAGSEAFTVDYNLPPPEYFAFWPQPMDTHGQSYTGTPLTAPVALIGSPVAHLTVAASHPEADLFVYVDQIDAVGKAEVISFGRLKLSHRKLSKAPYDTLGLPWNSGRAGDILPTAAGEKVKVSIALTPLSRVVPAGARLRLTVAGADPRQRNLKDIQLTPAPVITVFHGGKDASRIDLPVSK